MAYGRPSNRSGSHQRQPDDLLNAKRPVLGHKTPSQSDWPEMRRERTGRRWLPCRSSRRPDQRLAEGGQQPGQRNRRARFGPPLAIHPHPELARRREGHPRQLDFEVFVARIIFDRNSQIRFHKPMLTKAVAKTTVHAPVHARLPNTS